jgi:TRAP transporter TAXI family solute receptor
VRDYAGGDGNLRLIEANDRIQLGMTFAMNLAWARNRMTEITDATADNVRLIAGGLDQYYVGMIAQDSLGSSSITELLEAGEGLDFSTSQAGSTSEIGLMQILAAHGVDEATLSSRGGSISRVSLQAASENMATGRVDVWVQMIVAGHPRLSELAFSNDLQLLGMSDEAMSNLESRGFVPAELPGGVFQGIDDPVVMPGTSTILIANAAMDEEVAYAMTRGIIENIDAIKSENAALRNFTLERAADVESNGGAPLHPGAERAYREAGVI